MMQKVQTVLLQFMKNITNSRFFLFPQVDGHLLLPFSKGFQVVGAKLGFHHVQTTGNEVWGPPA